MTGGHDMRVSLAALLAVRPGQPPRLIYRTHRGRRGDKRTSGCPELAWTTGKDKPEITDRSEQGKTVTRILTDDQLADYQPWFDNQRRLRALVAELETLSQEIADSDPRWNR